MAQVIDQRLSDIDRQGQDIMPRSLAGDHDLASSPVHVIELQCRDLTAAQPEPRQQHQDREVAPASCGVAVTAREQHADLVAGKPAGQTLPSLAHRRHRVRQRHRDPALDVQKPQQRPQRAHHQLGRPLSALACLAQHERVNLPTGQAGQILGHRLGALPEKQARDRLIHPYGARRHPALQKQVVAKLRKQTLDWRWRLVLAGGEHAETVEIGQ